MAVARLVDDVIVLDVPYAEDYLAKTAPGMRYHVPPDAHSRKPHYTFPLSWASCVTLRGVFGDRLEVDPGLSRWAREEIELRIRPCLELAASLELPAEPARRFAREASRMGKLRPYQQVGAAFLATAGSAILADEMRLGKSMQAIAALKILDARPALLVVPNSTKWQWLEYLEQWWPEAKAEIVRGSTSQRRKTLAKLVEPCPIHGPSPYVTQTGRTTRRDPVETATSGVSESGTPNTQSDSGETLHGGTPIQGTSNGSGIGTGTTTSSVRTASTPTSTSVSPANSDTAVRSVDARRSGEGETATSFPSRLTTITEPERSEASSVQRVTARSGRSTKRRTGSSEPRCICADRPSVLIINWEALRMHSRQEGFGSVVSLAKCPAHGGDVTEAKCEVHPRELNEIKFRAVVADEAHRAVHPRAKQTRALWAVAWEADHRFALTGTPVLDTPVDIWALMHLIAPEEATQKTTWITRYCVVGFNGFAEEVTGLRPDTSQELFKYVDPRFLRRTREVVMPWLPEKVYTTRTVELGPKQRKAYNEMRKTMVAELDNNTVWVTNALTKLIRLRQFASAFAYVDENDDLKMQTPSCKADAMLEIAEELGGRSAVVFAESNQLIQITGKALERSGYTVGYVAGQILDEDEDGNPFLRAQTDGERAHDIAAFQRGDLRFICCTISAGGEGIALDRADTVVFLQRSFSLAKNAQAEDRIVGQEAGPGLSVIDIIAEDTIESRVLEVLGDKERIVEEVVRDKETFRRLLDD